MGAAGGAVLLVLYFSILTALNSFEHALTQFYEFWPWIVALVTGFGVQISLYSYVRAGLKRKSANAGKSIAASGSVSGTSMVLCCLHHAADVIPFLGLTALAVFLLQYQVFFLFVGVLSNIVGIILMLEIIQKHALSEGVFRKMLVFDMAKVKKYAVVSSVALVPVAFLVLTLQFGFPGASDLTLSNDSAPGVGSTQAQALNLATQTNNQNLVSVDVTPIDFAFERPAKFKVSLNTHSVDLQFDLTEIGILYDTFGNSYSALSWDGPPPGGHHSSGTLAFPEISGNAASMTLVLKGIAGVYERKFEWSLK